MTSHTERCRESVAEYGAQLASAVREGRLNASAVEGLISSYIEQPAYALMNKTRLMQIGLMQIGQKYP